MDAQDIDIIKNIGIPIGAFVAGFIVSRFTMSKKESKDVEQKIFENMKSLMESQNDRFQEFSKALGVYRGKTEAPTIDDFLTIATIGEKYFYQQKITADAILSGKVDRNSRDNTFVPKIKETIERILPLYYEVLQNIAKKHNLQFHGELRREDYESLYLVVEKYGRFAAKDATKP